MSTLKENAARAALAEVEDGMTLGLGSGSTSEAFLRLLAASGRDVQGVPTSDEVSGLATELGIPLTVPDEATVIDLAVDGADEADPRGDLIKGGGAALLREKIVASAARRFVVIADASKRVGQLGAFPLPVEVERFAWGLTVRRMREVLAEHGYAEAELTLRPAQGGFRLTDGGNYIVDLRLGRITDAAALDRALTMIPGVVGTGLFIGVADTIYFGTEAGAERQDVR
ncbi:ribose-5-phosphate isomerase RpiA [Parvularcula dongshanensis]|uniref:Ribose-5-phosphate isomerase A n=1 Tax=Parvularcula dongshanensis TaxID=1173995 RepID=A0A840I206_9PROT|nr:ribose-5-phosphate isomerase RpiA [Parvularcula dongshanensis]MBB4659046.1 ribose 5-phosphate isomerase A [Parvularcula dongshanensis]